MAYTLTGGITNDPTRSRLAVDIDVEMTYTDGVEDGTTMFTAPDNIFMKKFVGECTSRVDGAAAADFNQYLTIFRIGSGTGTPVWFSIQKHQGSTTGYFRFDRPIETRTLVGEQFFFNTGAFITPGATMKVRLRGIVEYYKL